MRTPFCWMQFDFGLIWYFLILIKSNQCWTVVALFRLFWRQAEFRLIAETTGEVIIAVRVWLGLTGFSEGFSVCIVVQSSGKSHGSCFKFLFSQGNLLEILLDRAEVWLCLPFSDGFETKWTSFWFQIDGSVINTILFRFDLIVHFWWIRRDFSVCRSYPGFFLILRSYWSKYFISVST